MTHVSTSNFEKFHSANPVVRWLIRRYFAVLNQILVECNPTKILDIGCGEGIIADAILRAVPDVHYLGVDRNLESITYARKLVPRGEFLCEDFFRRELDVGVADLVVCLEVLEHLEAPQELLSRLSLWSQQWVVVSVPWEPYFRAGNFLRCKYLRQWGNHPEHIQQFDCNSLKNVLSEHFHVVQIRTAFPWLFAVCCKVPSPSSP